MTHTRERGRQAEERVATLLMQFEWSLLDRNWRCRWGELDLVLVKGSRLLVVEVKAAQQAIGTATAWMRFTVKNDGGWPVKSIVGDQTIRSQINVNCSWCLLRCLYKAFNNGCVGCWLITWVDHLG